MKNIKFSIITPVYNTKPEFLDEYFDSVLNQTYENYEIIIINDGSNDETTKILEGYKKLSNKIILINQENKGMPVSRLNGLKASKGDYILNIDSDDILNVDTLKIFSKVLDKQDVDVILFGYLRFSKNKNNIVYTGNFLDKGIKTKNEIIKQLIQLHITSICTKCAKRELYNFSINNIDPTIILGEDLQQSTNLILNSNTFYYVDDSIYYYRVNEINRGYYDVKNLNDINYLVPTYKKVFVENHDYKDLLGIFKFNSTKSVIYRAFKICKYCKGQEKKYYLDELNKQPIINILNNINVKISFMYSFVYFLITKKLYLILDIASLVFNAIDKEY